MKGLIIFAVVFIILAVITYFGIAKPLTDWIVYDSARDLGNWVREFTEAMKNG